MIDFDGLARWLLASQKRPDPDGGIVLSVIDPLNGGDGAMWDTFTESSIPVAAGATSLTIELFSGNGTGTGNPASLNWIVAALDLEVDEVEEPILGRMTGGGSVFTLEKARVTRGFEIHCDLRDPNNIEVNWPGGNKYHMDILTSAVCTDEPGVNPDPPPDTPFDTFTGVGTGKLNGVPGATINFVFVDAGEPGDMDTAEIRVTDPDGIVVLNVSGFLDRGNVQAHEDKELREVRSQ